MKNKYFKAMISILIVFSIMLVIFNSKDGYEFYSSLHTDIVDMEGNVLLEANCSEDLYVDVFFVSNQEKKGIFYKW